MFSKKVTELIAQISKLDASCGGRYKKTCSNPIGKQIMKTKTFALIVLLAVTPVLFGQGVELQWLRIIPTPGNVNQVRYSTSSDQFMIASSRFLVWQGGDCFAFLDTLGVVHTGDSMVAVQLGNHQYFTGGNRVKCTKRTIPAEKYCANVDEWVRTVYDGVLFCHFLHDSVNPNNQQFVFQKYSAGYKLEWESRVNQRFSRVNAIKQVGDDFVVMSTTQIINEASTYPQFLKISGVDGSKIWNWVGDTTEDYSYRPRMSDFAPTADGGIIAVGGKNKPNNVKERWSSQPYLICLNGFGKVKWERYFIDSLQVQQLGDFILHKGGELRDILPLRDGSYLTCGEKSVANNGRYFRVLKVDPYFNIIWEKLYAFDNSDMIVRETHNSHIVILNESLLVLDSKGDSLTRFTFPVEPWPHGFKVKGMGSMILGEKDYLYFTCSGYDPTIRNSGNALLKFRLPLANRGRDQQPQDGQEESLVVIPSTCDITSIFPNPFNPQTTISYTTAVASDLTVAVYDLSGKVVANLVNGFTPAGSHSVNWNAVNLANGVYVVRLQGEGFSTAKKIVLMK